MQSWLGGKLFAPYFNNSSTSAGFSKFFSQSGSLHMVRGGEESHYGPGRMREAPWGFMARADVLQTGFGLASVCIKHVGRAMLGQYSLVKGTSVKTK